MTSTRTTDDIVDQAEPTFDALADRVARRDAEALALAPGAPSPTPGETELQAKAATTLTELAVADRLERRDAEVQHRMNTDVLAAHEAEEPVDVPDRVPLRRTSPAIYVLIGLLALAETAALADPFGTLLNVSEHSVERYLVPGVLSLLGVLLAHVSGSFSARHRRSTAPEEQDEARRLARVFAAAVAIIGIAATSARIFTANLDASLAGGEVLDPTALGTFALLQLGFVASSLAASSYHFRRVTDAEQERLRSYLAGVAAENRELAARLEHADERAAEQRSIVTDAFGASVRRYRTWLAERHPSVAGQVAWTARTARDLEDGLIDRLLASAVIRAATDPGPVPRPDRTPSTPPRPHGPDPGRHPDPTRPGPDPTVVAGTDPTVVSPATPDLDLTRPIDPDPAADPACDLMDDPPRWSPRPRPDLGGGLDPDDADLFDAILTPPRRD